MGNKKAENKTFGPSEMIAKKDWHIVQNEIDVKIKEGEPLPEGLSDKLLEALKTEKVI